MQKKTRNLVAALDIVLVIFVLAYFVPKPTIGLVVFDGNSMTDGQFSTFPGDVERALGPFWKAQNFGVSGQSTIEMLDDAERQIDTLPSPTRYKILVVWEGSNDLYHGAPVDASYARLVEYCKGRKEAGYTVMVLSLLPRTLEKHAWYEHDRSELNALLREDFPEAVTDYLYRGTQYADYFLDVAADSRIGNFGDETDTRFYYDQVHMTQRGYAIIAKHVTSSINTISR